MQTLYVTPGTTFYFQDALQVQRQYTCLPEDEGGCYLQKLSKSFTTISNLTLRLFCNDEVRTLTNTTYDANAAVEFSLMKGSIHINGTGKKVRCGGDSTIASKGNKPKRPNAQYFDQQASADSNTGAN
jgi:hypothetical protein